ncbi:MAG: ExeM/NucH family extracellular endonuclease [Actinobacteria bacterium]|nr:ExeM/NucH family extracellular endonuclease [Actinomycetota bacterium]
MKRKRWTVLAIFAMVVALLPLSAAPAAGTAGTSVFINEIHYDNTGGDTGEAVEVAGPAGTDLTGWSIVLYNGSGGANYGTIDLSGTIPDQMAGYGTLSFPQASIQNGAPDGLALVDNSSTVVQFLSYEGTFTATTGPADGMTSTDIGVSESSSTPVGDSLQLVGTGSIYEDFTWTGPTPATFGAVNTGQTLTAVPAPDVTNTIYEIQYTTGDASPLAGQTVVTEGVVTAVFGRKVFIQDGTGPFSGLYLYNPSPIPAVGNVVRVQGQVKEYHGKTEIDGGALWNIGPGTFPAPEVLATGDIAREQWESVFVRAENATVVDPDLGHGEWSVDDDSGPVRVDDLGSYGYVPYAGDPVTFVQGPLDYAYGNFKIEPRDDGDLFVDLRACGLRYTPIYDIQGSGDASPIEGSMIWTEGVVTADFQESSELKGFFLQDAAGDGDVATSDGIFVYQKAMWGDVEVGQHLRFQAKVAEYYGLTELKYVSDLTVCGSGSVTPTAVDLPVAEDDREPYEGMLLTFPESLAVADSYNLTKYGEVILSADGRLFAPTNQFAPSFDWYDSNDSDGVAEILEPRLLVLDDASNHQYPDPVPYIQPYGTLRWGDTTTDLTGVLTYAYGAYKLEPTEAVVFSEDNPRPGTPPGVGGVIKVGSFNLHNWWTTLGGRGARSESQLEKQGAKLVAAITGLGADVIGVQELENNGDTAVSALVDLLNAEEGAGTWDYIRDPDYPGGIEATNAIKVGIIYKPAVVSPVGDAQWSLDASFAEARPPLAQTFEFYGDEFTLVVNHFKSKGYYGDTLAEGDEDIGDGQGYYNATRVSQARAVVEFVSALEDAGKPNVLAVGDLNVYAKEDPVVVLEADLENLLAGLPINDKYSYTYYGQAGELDYAFANDAMQEYVRGAGIWHIDAAEPVGFNYYGASSLYAADPFRASDHDPVIVGVCELIPPEIYLSADPDVLFPPNHRYVEVNVDVTVVDNYPQDVEWHLVSVVSNEPDNGRGDGNTVRDIVIIDDTTFLLRAERSGHGDGRIYTATYEATDSCGNTTVATVTITVPRGHGMRPRMR